MSQRTDPDQIPSLAIRCESKGCPREGELIERITGFDSAKAREQTIKDWFKEENEEYNCEDCKTKGTPEVEEPCVICLGRTQATPFPCMGCSEPLCQDCEEIHNCDNEDSFEDEDDDEEVEDEE